MIISTQKSIKQLHLTGKYPRGSYIKDKQLNKTRKLCDHKYSPLVEKIKEIHIQQIENHIEVNVILRRNQSGFRRNLVTTKWTELMAEEK